MTGNVENALIEEIMIFSYPLKDMVHKRLWNILTCLIYYSAIKYTKVCLSGERWAHSAVLHDLSCNWYL
ncbi:MAG: hypothetical protein C4522_16475 [Desulfobacteraceae bacterium]|nr:MAG: hypothetical protein C4522_16475 [Desulfobacteraceae bacterium]